MENLLNSYLPLFSSIITYVFAATVLHRWWTLRRRAHLLLWGIGLLMYATGGLMEAFYGLFGWHPLVFRVWYLFGAVLVAAWLGQGTVYLLIRKRVAGVRIAHILMGVLFVGSVYAASRVFSAQLDPSRMIAGELSGHAIITPGVRVLTPFFNIYGVLMLVGGAIYSAWIFWRKRIMINRTVGNILIATGALAPAFGGAFQRFGIPFALYLGEFMGAVLMFMGFLYATRPAEESAPRPAVQAGR